MVGQGLLWPALVGAFLTSGGVASASDVRALEVVSNRADLISGGDALVSATLAAGAAGVRVDVDGVDVTSAFATRPNGRFEGVVTGIKLGVDVLTVRGADGAGKRITITVVLDRRERELGLDEALAPGLGELDDVPPAVLARAPPLDQLLGFELVEQADEVRAVDLQRRREFLLRDPPSGLARMSLEGDRTPSLKPLAAESLARSTSCGPSAVLGEARAAA